MAGISTDNPETATQLITRAFLEQPARPEIAVHRIERDDGTVDYDAWRRNRINIFQRWRKRETAEHCEKFLCADPRYSGGDPAKCAGTA